MPQYITDMITPYQPARVLRSAGKDLLVEPKYNLATYGYRAFTNHAPRLWNSLPHDLRQNKSVNNFRKDLKTVLFRRAYDL